MEICYKIQLFNKEKFEDSPANFQAKYDKN